MPIEQFDTNFGHLGHSEFIVTLSNFADSLLAHSFFKDNWPPFVPHPTTLKEQLGSYNDAVRVFEIEGGRKNHKNRDESRDTAHASAILIGQYVIMRSISEKRPELLEGISLKRRTRSARSSKEMLLGMALAAPGNVTVKHGTVSGIIVVSYNKVPGAGSYEIFLGEGEPAAEQSYAGAGQYASCRVELKGLEPAKKINVKVRCHGKGDPGPFSQPVSIIVL